MNRRKYYDFFSKFYDCFIKIHSKDKSEKLRNFFAELILKNGNNLKILDICCGTGSTTKFLQKNKNLVIGIDFSYGMLQKAKEKCKNPIFILGDVSKLPFKENSFDVVTCTYAFYELKGNNINKTLLEIKRILTTKGIFFMMEHEVPKNAFIKFLFYLRLLTMGFKKALNILKHEEKTFKSFFTSVEKISSPSGNSKIYICKKNST